jgi:hypothetical protein
MYRRTEALQDENTRVIGVEEEINETAKYWLIASIKAFFLV